MKKLVRKEKTRIEIGYLKLVVNKEERPYSIEPQILKKMRAARRRHFGIVAGGCGK